MMQAVLFSDLPAKLAVLFYGSHNACTICTMYKDSRFRIRPLEEIEGIINRAATAMPYTRRIFLADGDALVLPTESLLQILNKCRTAFPS